jgi:hypothetical protein
MENDVSKGWEGRDDPLFMKNSLLAIARNTSDDFTSYTINSVVIVTF